MSRSECSIMLCRRKPSQMKPRSADRKAAEQPSGPFMQAAGLAFVLFAPVAAFLRYHGWTALSWEGVAAFLTASAVGALVLALPVLRRPLPYSLMLGATLVFFVDFQVKTLESQWLVIVLALVFAAVAWLLPPRTPTAVAVMFGVMAALSLPPTRSKMPAEPSDLSLPPVLYLLLDAHLAPSDLGMEDDSERAIRTRLESLYLARGFRLYENGYSQFDKTLATIPAMLNGQGSSEGLTEEAGVGHLMIGNRLFDAHHEAGYQVVAFHSRYLDPCPPYAACFPYSNWSFRVLAEEAAGLQERLQTVLGAVTERSSLLTAVRWRYKSLRARVSALPEWRPGTFAPAATGSNSLEAAEALLEQEPRGRFVYLHLIDPHSPYAFNPDCSLTASATWIHELGGRPAYLAQLECLLLRLEGVFDRLFADPRFEGATVVVHGDHGARIEGIRAVERIEEAIANGTDLEAPDLAPEIVRALRDRFSTLLAIRSPTTRAGLVTEPRSVNAVLAELWGWPYLATEERLQSGTGANLNFVTPFPQAWAGEVGSRAGTSTEREPD